MLSSRGLLDVISTLGIRFEAESLSFDSLADLEGVLAELPRSQALLAGALTVVAHGNLALESGREPAVVLSLEDDPITAYLGCLQFLERWMDVHAGSAEDADDLGDPELHLMLAMAHAANRKQAEERVAALLAEKVTTVRIVGGNQPLELVRPSTTVLVLYNKENEETGRLGTFTVREVPLAEAPELANMPMPHSAGQMELSDGTLRQRLFPESEYPDPTVVDQTQVECTVGVAPLQGEEPIYFKVGVKVGRKAQKIDIVTAERWHTGDRDIRVGKGREDRQVLMGPPSQASSHAQELFMAQTKSTLGPQGRNVLERIGEEASQSVIIGLKLYISPSQAAFRKKVIIFKQGPQEDSDIQRIAYAIVYDKDADTIEWLSEHGWLGDKEGKIRNVCRRLESTKWQMELSSGFGSGGGALMQGGGDLLGSSLYTGASGMFGGSIGVSYEEYEVDPLTPPRILVFRVIGVQGGGEV